MQNKSLRFSLIIAIVFVSLNELALFCNELIPRLLSRFMEIDFYQWMSLGSHVSSVLIGGFYLSLMVAGISLIAGNKSGVMAWIGGGLMAFHGLLSFVRIVLYYIFRVMERFEAIDLLYHQGVTWCFVLLYAAALIMVAVHYKSGALIGIASAKAVVGILVQTAAIFLEQGRYTTYSIITGTGSLIGFVLSLLFFIFWLRQVPKQ